MLPFSTKIHCTSVGCVFGRLYFHLQEDCFQSKFYKRTEYFKIRLIMLLQSHRRGDSFVPEPILQNNGARECCTPFSFVDLYVDTVKADWFAMHWHASSLPIAEAGSLRASLSFRQPLFEWTMHTIGVTSLFHPLAVKQTIALSAVRTL